MLAARNGGWPSQDARYLAFFVGAFREADFDDRRARARFEAALLAVDLFVDAFFVDPDRGGVA